MPPTPIGPGNAVAGFEIERELESGSLGTVYEAVQPSVGRSVALRLIPEGEFQTPEAVAEFDREQRKYAALHHPRLVPTYEAGSWEGGRFVASRLVRGRTLADHLADGTASTLGGAELLDPIEDALRVAHEAGLIHGRINARNILIADGAAAFLADFGLGRKGSAAEDRAALNALEGEIAAIEPERPSRRRVALLAATLVALAALAIAVSFGSDDTGPGDDDLPAPEPPAGTAALGSDLAAGDLEQVGCSSAPSANTPACSLAQGSVDGDGVVAERAGVVRGWAVRGAEGDVALQVIGERRGKAVVRGFTQYEQIEGETGSFEANLPVRAGDRLALSLGTGALVGAREARESTRVLQWEGGLADIADRPGETRSGVELLLRADIEYGARPEPPVAETGRDAIEAEAGEELERLDLAFADQDPAEVVVVELENAIAVDLFSEGRRRFRIEVEGAEVDGALGEFRQGCGVRESFCLRWVNPVPGSTVFHEYVLRRDGTAVDQIG